MTITFVIQTSINTTAQTNRFRYITKPGKTVGIWPDTNRYSAGEFAKLKNRWGFSSILVVPIDAEAKVSKAQYTDALKAGFKAEEIMVCTWDDNYIFAVDSLPAGFYYLDEPVEHNCAGHPSNGFVSHIYSPAELAARRDYVHFMRPDSKFVIDGYKRCSHLVKAAEKADQIMYSSYVNWNPIPVLSIFCRPNIGWGDEYDTPFTEGSSLQTDSWSDMRSRFGSKFSMSWVKASSDEYMELFTAANHIGLNGIWLYEYQCGDSASIENFCNAAYQKGWLDRADENISGILDFKAPVMTFALKQNFPNPFNPSTTISYDLPADGKVSLSIYNSSGRKVCLLVNELQAAGSYKYEWNSSGMSSGVYFSRLTFFGQKSWSAVSKMTLMK